MDETLKLGRPSAMTPEVLQKLEWAFKLGASDREACNEADIAPQTLYNYQNENPDFLEQKEGWKATLTFRARKTVAEHLEYDPQLAMRYLERKLPEEFGRSEHTLKLKPVKQKTLEDLLRESAIRRIDKENEALALDTSKT